MKRNKKRIFADYAAGAPITAPALRAFRHAERLFGNPSSYHEEGRTARSALSSARKDVAFFFNAKPDEVIFTASGTESNAIALSGGINQAAKEKGGFQRVHVVTSIAEHPSVRETLRLFEEQGVRLSYVPLKSDGRIDLNMFAECIQEDTALVSLHYVQSEIGVIQPIRKAKEIIDSKGSAALFHIDACQAAPWLPLHVDSLGADLVSIDSVKVGGPRGMGALFIRRGTKISPLFGGGGQEGGLRSGTENVPGAVGFSVALLSVVKMRKKRGAHLVPLRDELIKGVLSVPETCVNGSMKERVPNNVHVSALNAPAELVVSKLDALGVSSSTGTACSAKEDGSAVMRLIAPDEVWRAKTSIRLTLSPQATRKDIIRIVDAYQKAVFYARGSRMS